MIRFVLRGRRWRVRHPQFSLQFAPVAFLETIQTCGRRSGAGIDVAVQRLVALAHLLPLAHREAVAVAAGDQLLGAQLLDELGIDLGQMHEADGVTDREASLTLMWFQRNRLMVDWQAQRELMASFEEDA